MAVIQKGEAEYPFWGSSYSLERGLDPLGLQTTSEAIYSRLLPGVTNLTNRLRYYGFYCWLLDLYWHRESVSNTTEQNRFIRRSELLIALMMQFYSKRIPQITGSLFAQSLAQESSNRYDLRAGADPDSHSPRPYWKYSSGAFGQYYYGALSLLGLVTLAEKDGIKIFKATQGKSQQQVSGHDLAEAFEASLNVVVIDLFYAVVKRGEVARDELEQLMPFFAIDQVSVNSTEWDFYGAMLLDRDYPWMEEEQLSTGYRKETIQGLLQTAQQNSTPLSGTHYIQTCYRNQLGSQHFPASPTHIGWYAYQLNDYWQYACGAIFWGMQHELRQEANGRHLYGFMDDLATAITAHLVAEVEFVLSPQSPAQDLLELLSQDAVESDLEAKIKDAIKCGEGIIASATGFRLLFQLLKNNQDKLQPLRVFVEQQEMIRDGNMVDGLEYINALTSVALTDLIKQFVVQKIMYRHQFVALRKMGSGNKSTLKFFLEDNYIRFHDNFEPQHSSPRLWSVGNLLYDLRLVDEQNGLTDLGSQCIADS